MGSAIANIWSGLQAVVETGWLLLLGFMDLLGIFAWPALVLLFASLAFCGAFVHMQRKTSGCT